MNYLSPYIKIYQSQIIQHNKKLCFMAYFINTLK